MSIEIYSLSLRGSKHSKTNLLQQGLIQQIRIVKMTQNSALPGTRG